MKRFASLKLNIYDTNTQSEADTNYSNQHKHVHKKDTWAC